MAAAAPAAPTSASGTKTLPANNGAGSTTFSQTTPQPLSNADRTGSGANTSGPFNATGFGQVQGGHAAGSVGKADNKNPPGQVGNTHNRGYECNVNPGIGNGNPAHTTCVTPNVSPPPPNQGGGPGGGSGTLCDSSGSGEALFTVPAGSPPPSYNLTTAAVTTLPRPWSTSARRSRSPTSTRRDSPPPAP